MELYEKLTSEWHTDKNGNLKMSNLTPSSAKKIWWKCLVNPRHEWEARFFSRSQNGADCPYCTGKKVMPEDSMAVKHPNLLAEWMYDKNIGLDPFNLLPKSGKVAWWQCTKGHTWRVSITHRTFGGRDKKGTGCPYCSNQKIDLNNCIAATDPQVLKEWHPRNTISPTEIGRGSIRKVWWKCDKADDHEWQASPCYKIVGGTGCPCCAGRKIVLSNCLATTHPDIATEWHEKNKLTPKEVTHSSNKRVWFKCSVDPTHEWQCLIYDRTRGTQCPFCASSKGEKLIKEYLKKLEINFDREYRIKECKNIRPLPFDFVILKNDALLGLIEYQGIHHYMPRDFLGGVKRFMITKRNDSIKKKYCEDNGINLLIIPYTEMAKIKDLIDEFLLKIS